SHVLVLFPEVPILVSGPVSKLFLGQTVNSCVEFRFQSAGPDAALGPSHVRCGVLSSSSGAQEGPKIWVLGQSLWPQSSSDPSLSKVQTTASQVPSLVPCLGLRIRVLLGPRSPRLGLDPRIGPPNLGVILGAGSLSSSQSLMSQGMFSVWTPVGCLSSARVQVLGHVQLRGLGLGPRFGPCPGSHFRSKYTQLCLGPKFQPQLEFSARVVFYFYVWVESRSGSQSDHFCSVLGLVLGCLGPDTSSQNLVCFKLWSRSSVLGVLGPSPVWVRSCLSLPPRPRLDSESVILSSYWLRSSPLLGLGPGSQFVWSRAHKVLSVVESNLDTDYEFCLKTWVQILIPISGVPDVVPFLVLSVTSSGPRFKFSLMQVGAESKVPIPDRVWIKLRSKYCFGIWVPVRSMS
uniref:Uncharacterized protein n=1 Tax=Cannabis sativa TaxID=3483 RepID=A0A803QRC2_CANSA